MKASALLLGLGLLLTSESLMAQGKGKGKGKPDSAGNGDACFSSYLKLESLVAFGPRGIAVTHSSFAKGRGAFFLVRSSNPLLEQLAGKISPAMPSELVEHRVDHDVLGAIFPVSASAKRIIMSYGQRVSASGDLLNLDPGSSYSLLAATIQEGCGIRFDDRIQTVALPEQGGAASINIKSARKYIREVNGAFSVEVVIHAYLLSGLGMDTVKVRVNGAEKGIYNSLVLQNYMHGNRLYYPSGADVAPGPTIAVFPTRAEAESELAQEQLVEVEIVSPEGATEKAQVIASGI